MTIDEAITIARDQGPFAAYRAVCGDHWAAALTAMPQHMHEAIVLWVLFGVHPGGFLAAVLSNDLFGALGSADHINRDCLPAYANFFYNFAPSECFGNASKVNAWTARGGLLRHDAHEGAA